MMFLPSPRLDSGHCSKYESGSNFALNDEGNPSKAWINPNYMNLMHFSCHCQSQKYDASESERWRHTPEEASKQ